MPIIGREAPADIILPAPQVSARHAEIRHIQGNSYSLTDLHSTNGTYVNGKRIQSATIALGDKINFGSFSFNLQAYCHLIPRTDAVPPAHPFREPPTAKPDMPKPASIQAAPKPPAPAAAQQQPQPSMGRELEVALAAQKSFTGRAFITWILYWIFYVPGLVMNLVWWNEAKSVKKVTGRSPSGMGCLTFLLIVHIILPIILIILFIFAGAAMFAWFKSIF
jgi:hypothetical protein